MNKDLFVIWNGVFYYDNKGVFRCSEGTQTADVIQTLDNYVGQKVHLFMMHQPKMLVDGNLDKGAILAASQSWGLGSCFWSPMGKCPYGHHHPSKQRALFNQQCTGLLEKDINGLYTVGGEHVHLEYADGHQTIFALFLHEDELEIASSNFGEVLTMQENLMGFLNVLQGLKKASESVDTI